MQNARVALYVGSISSIEVMPQKQPVRGAFDIRLGMDASDVDILMIDKVTLATALPQWSIP